MMMKPSLQVNINPQDNYLLFSSRFLLGFWIVISLLCVTQLTANPSVLITGASQRTDSSKKVDIYYKLVHDKPVTISIYASQDNGVTWSLPITKVSENVGPGVWPGNNKHIIWDVLAEHPNIVFDNVKFKVVADDGVVDLTAGLIAYYPFNGSYTNASSYSISSSNYGVLLCPDRFDQENFATTYNGSSYIRINSTPFLDIKRSISISCWIKPSSTNNCWFAWRGDTQWARDPYCFGIQNQSLMFRRDYMNADANGQVITYPINYEFISSWHHVAATYDHSLGMYRLYIDGALANEILATPTEATFATSSFWNCIGAVDNGSQYYKGKLDDLRIYNRALSYLEIMNLYLGD